MCDAEWGGLQPQPWHHNIVLAPPDPNLLESTPKWHKYNRVRVHPNAIPQNMKVLQHFIYMDYGCVMQSER